MSSLVIYVHGMGGGAEESARFKPLFPSREVVGLDYRSFTPWEAGAELRAAAQALRGGYGDITLIANSIGAFFSMHAGLDALLRKAYFISPVVDMERMILGMMAAEKVSETELKEKGEIPVSSGPALSWEYLRWVRAHPVRWNAPTEILYGGGDTLVPRDTVAAFAKAHGAGLTVMENGEHRFHTEEQLRFLDEWIRRKERRNASL